MLGSEETFEANRPTLQLHAKALNPIPLKPSTKKIVCSPNSKLSKLKRHAPSRLSRLADVFRQVLHEEGYMAWLYRVCLYIYICIYIYIYIMCIYIIYTHNYVCICSCIKHGGSYGFKRWGFTDCGIMDAA